MDTHGVDGMGFAQDTESIGMAYSFRADVLRVVVDESVAGLSSSCLD